MKSRHFRYSSHPLTRAIDTAIDARRTTGQPVNTGYVSSDLVSTVPAALMLTEFERLVGPRVNARLKARGEIVVDNRTWERRTDVDVTDTEFTTYTSIKREHVQRCARRLRADTAVEKFLAKQAARKGRPVTMGEFESQIDAIYARHGLRP